VSKSTVTIVVQEIVLVCAQDVDFCVMLDVMDIRIISNLRKQRGGRGSNPTPATNQITDYK